MHDEFTVDTSNDIFVNPIGFNNVIGGMGFIDKNNDGIVDYAKDTPYFHFLGIGSFIYENSDSIHDEFQSLGSCRALGMTNFLDVYRDDICDKYEENPFINSMQQ